MRQQLWTAGVAARTFSADADKASPRLVRFERLEHVEQAPAVELWRAEERLGGNCQAAKILQLLHQHLIEQQPWFEQICRLTD